jgi:alpha-L-arabinofuranosidase
MYSRHFQFFLLIIAFIVFAPTPFLSSQTFDATIKIKPELNNQTIKKTIYGAFTEYMNQVQNGTLGANAQELQNRGFDFPNSGNNIGKYWSSYIFPVNGRVNYFLSPGGYNLNGNYMQFIIINDTNSIGGVSQKVWLEKDSYKFYVYAKGDNNNQKLRLLLGDSQLNNVYWQSPEVNLTTEWKKYEFETPFLTIPFAWAFINAKGQGTVAIDEASLVQSSAKFNLRWAYFEEYKKMQPGSMRYPGGCFTDIKTNFWEKGIGDIDQRRSPNPDWNGYSQRFEFGTDDFLQFCEELNIEPFITVNYGERTPQDAASLVEYCNGDSNTYWGKKRAENGHLKPYGVKYFEIGNEQYGPWEIGHTTPAKYAQRAMTFVYEMKKVDSTITCILDCDIWNTGWTDTVMSNTPDSSVAFSWHFSNGTKDYSSPEEKYIQMVSCQVLFGGLIDSFNEMLFKHSINPSNKNAISEWWPSWIKGGFSDTLYNLQLGEGLWTALALNEITKRSDQVFLASRTSFYGLIQGRYNDEGRRIIFSGPAAYSINMIKKAHAGGSLTNIDRVIAPRYYFKFDYDEFYVPYLDCVASYRNDSLNISIINRKVSDTGSLIIILDSLITESGNLFLPHDMMFKKTVLTSEKVDDMNNQYYPEKIIPKETEEIFNDYIEILPHSLTTLSIPLQKAKAQDSIISKPLRIFPNPFDNYIYLDLTSFKTKVKLSIFDITGKLIFYNEILPERLLNYEDTYNLNKGTYIINISDGEKNKGILSIKK